MSVAWFSGMLDGEYFSLRMLLGLSPVTLLVYTLYAGTIALRDHRYERAILGSIMGIIIYFAANFCINAVI